jgi:hypothetical protein
MAARETPEQLLAAYPQLVGDDLRACMEYAAALASQEAAKAESKVKAPRKHLAQFLSESPLAGAELKLDRE